MPLLNGLAHLNYSLSEDDDDDADAGCTATSYIPRLPRHHGPVPRKWAAHTQSHLEGGDYRSLHMILPD
jgi:hypothetical protein